MPKSWVLVTQLWGIPRPRPRGLRGGGLDPKALSPSSPVPCLLFQLSGQGPRVAAPGP